MIYFLGRLFGGRCPAQKPGTTRIPPTVQLVLIMQPDDGKMFCSEPVALHGCYMGGIAS